MNTEQIQHDLIALFQRLKLVILSPKECWNTIAGEDESPKKILTSRVIPLIVLGIICTIVGYTIFGISTPWSPLFVIVSGVVQVVQLYIAAWLVVKLASFFQGTATESKAFSFVAHSMLPSLAAGLLGIIPPLGILRILLAIISMYTFYQGVSKMTTVPENQKLGFTASFIVAMLLISMVLGFATAMFVLGSQLKM